MSIGRPVDLRIVRPNWLTVWRQVGLRLRHAVLHVHLIDVRIGLTSNVTVSVIVPSLALVDCM